jgi:MEMO1 family protein
MTGGILDRGAEPIIIDHMKSMIGRAKVRDATVAGIFYPDDPTELRDRIAALLEAARPQGGPARAILAPHAGLDYSGDLSALAWKSALGRPVDTVLVLSPLHRAEESLVYLPESEYFEMPNGRIEVDLGTVDELRDTGTMMAVNDIPHLEEHGIELQLPFLIETLPKARLVPILVGRPTQALVKALASALALVFSGREASTLFVLSSDLGSSSDDGQAARLADGFVEAFLSSDHAALFGGIGADGAACGSGCASAFLASGLAGAARPILLGRHDSSASRETGEERLVHYGALAFVDG